MPWNDKKWLPNKIISGKTIKNVNIGSTSKGDMDKTAKRCVEWMGDTLVREKLSFWYIFRIWRIYYYEFSGFITMNLADLLLWIWRIFYYEFSGIITMNLAELLLWIWRNYYYEFGGFIIRNLTVIIANHCNRGNSIV